MKNSAAEKGFTMMELMIVVALMPMLFFALYSTFTMANVVLQTDDVYSRVNQSAIQIVRNINREVGQTSPNLLPLHLSITVDGNNNNVMRFQVPVDSDGDGDVTNGAANPAVEWGATDQAPGVVQTSLGQTQLTLAPRLGAWIQYTVVVTVVNANLTTRQLVRDVLDSALVLVPGTRQIIASNVAPTTGANVPGFRAARVLNTLTTTLTLRATDTIGQGGAARTLGDTTFTSSTILRNAVN